MKIAIPVVEGKLSLHFGHCEVFALVDVDDISKEIVSIKEMVPPPHEPGVLPQWLGELKADVIISGGMGQRAQTLFEAQNIKVIVGAPVDSPENIVRAYMDKTLAQGQNVCDH